VAGAMRDTAILSAKLFTNLTKEIPVLSKLVGRCYMDHGLLFPCVSCPSQGKRKVFYLPSLVGGQQ